MNRSDIANYRIFNQGITNHKFTDAVEVVEGLGAIQAQEYAQTKWSLGLRLPDTKDADIEEACSKGKILRTHLLRPTWHFVSAKDIRWILMLTAQRVHSANAYMYRKLELDDTLFNRCNQIILKTLEGGKRYTRDKINEEFVKNKIEAQGLRLSYIMMYAELEGIICSGARQGNQFTYALLDDLVPSKDLLDKEEALGELTKRYFLSRGPATIKDFSTWSGLTLSDCKKGLQMVNSYLVKTMVDDQEYYSSTHIPTLEKNNQNIYPLPIYDEVIMGYKDRSAFMQHLNSLKQIPPFRYDCMIVSEGQIIGTWKRILEKRMMIVERQFFQPLTKSQEKAFEIAVQKLAAFTGVSVGVAVK